MADISLEKYDLLQTIELALTEGGKHILYGTVGWFRFATTAAWIETDVLPYVRDHNQAAHDAGKMTDADNTITDLKAALAQNLHCEKHCKTIADREKLLEQTKKLREEWSLDGSALYKQPGWSKRLFQRGGRRTGQLTNMFVCRRCRNAINRVSTND
jgi:hypothetical protein